MPLELEKRLKKKHQYDLALYEYAKARWQSWKKENIPSDGDIINKDQILTIMSDYMALHEANYMGLEK